VHHLTSFNKAVLEEMQMEDTKVADSLVKEYAKIDKLAATILEDKQQVIELEVPFSFI